MTVKFYFINLDRCTDRLERFRNEISFHSDITFKRFSAIQGIKNDNNISPGSYGCSMSHYGVLEDFLNSTFPYAVILEDDIILTCNFSEQIKFIPTLLRERWGVIWLGQTLNNHNWGGRPQPVIYEHDEMFLECSFPLGSFGYLVNREGAKAILESKKTRFTFYDVELMKACDRNQWKKFILKNPIVYANVWDISTIETNNITKLHETVDISLYRRDFEINNLLENKSLIKYFNREHLLVGNVPDDYSTEEIMNMYEGFKEKGDVNSLKKLLTYRQKVTTTYHGEVDIEYFGRSLYFLRFLPVKIYIENLKFIEKIPKFTHNKYIIGKTKVKKDELFIRMAKYHYLNRWNFIKEIKDISFVGHRCFDYPINNYFFNGTPKMLMIAQDIKTTLSYSNAKSRLNFLRAINNVEHIQQVAKVVDYPLDKKTIAFTSYPDPKYLSNAAIVTSDFYADVLVHQEDISHRMGKCNILDVKTPRILNTKEFNLIVNSAISPIKCPNEIWVPLFLRRYCNLEELESRRRHAAAIQRTSHISLQRPNEEIEEKLEAKVIDKDDYPRFMVVIEDFLNPGYISERILSAYEIGAVPVYLGAKEVMQFFNENSFMYINNYGSFEELRRTLTVELYEKMINVSIWKHDTPRFMVNI